MEGGFLLTTSTITKINPSELTVSARQNIFLSSNKSQGESPKMITTKFLAYSAACALAAGAANAAITVSNIVTKQPTSGLTSTTYFATSDGTGSGAAVDKLVVVVAGEHNFGGNTGGFVNNLFYGGVAMTQAVNRNPVDGTNITTGSIWYLDNPGTSGGFTVSVGGNGNNYAWLILGLTGTADGVGATAVSALNSKTVDLTTVGLDSYVIAAHGLGGNGNTGSVAGITANAPSTLLGAIAANTYAGIVVSGVDEVDAGTATYGFTGGNAAGNFTFAAEFRAIPEPSAALLGGVGLLALLRRRR
jgi:hypothetical protein